MKYYQLFWIDSVLTLAIGLYLIVVGFDLFKSSFHVLMLYTPKDIQVEELVKKVCVLSEIKNMHHVHLWQLNEEEVHLEAHVDLNKNINLSEFEIVLEKMKEILHHDFGINHVTIQPEFDACDNKAVIVQH